MCVCVCVCVCVRAHTGVYIHGHVRFVCEIRTQSLCKLYKPMCVCVWRGRVCVCKDTVGRCVAGNNASA